MEALIKSSLKICLHWISWLIERGTGNGKLRLGLGAFDNRTEQSGGKWTALLYTNEDEYDEELEEEYGEEIALQKYGAAKIYERLMIGEMHK